MNIYICCNEMLTDQYKQTVLNQLDTAYNGWHTIHDVEFNLLNEEIMKDIHEIDHFIHELSIMAKADLIVFMPRWKTNQELRLLHIIAAEYDISTIYL